MNRSPASYHRKRTRLLPAITTIVVVVLLLCLGWLGLQLVTQPAQYRQSTVLVSDKVYVVSWDSERKHVVLVGLLGSVAIEGARGYGRYPLFSLLKLDTIDRHGGRLFVESLSDALGLPLVGMMQISQPSESSNSIEFLREVFSWQSLFEVGKRRSISWGTWASWVLATASLKADQVETISTTHALADQVQPDGSIVSIFDSQRFDYLYGNLFTDARIRTEGITVSVYNTTEVPTIGQRAARILSQLGISVVTVGNDETKLSRCILTGTQESLRSQTAEFIRSYFHCDVKKIDETQGTSDLSLQLGSDYAAIFVSRK